MATNLENMSTDRKFDVIIKRLNSIENNIKKINERINEVDKKLHSASARLDTHETKFETKCQEIESLQTLKVDVGTKNKLKERLAYLKNSHANHEKAKIMQESYDKRLNSLIHGVKDDGDNVWKKKKNN